MEKLLTIVIISTLFVNGCATAIVTHGELPEAPEAMPECKTATSISLATYTHYGFWGGESLQISPEFDSLVKEEAQAFS